MTVLSIGLLYGAATLVVMFSGMPIAFALGAVATMLLVFVRDERFLLGGLLFVVANVALGASVVARLSRPRISSNSSITCSWFPCLWAGSRNGQYSRCLALGKTGHSWSALAQTMITVSIFSC